MPENGSGSGAIEDDERLGEQPGAEGAPPDYGGEAGPAGYDGELPGYDRIHRLLARELGDELADAFARTRRAQEAWEREHLPGEGLRERKKRVTRQRISDVATTLFVVRGFEHVKVAEVAEIVGVSEKTVFNYFPTKEAMVFDEADEGIERLAVALREREPGESLTRVVVGALAQDLRRHGAVADELTYFFLPSFAEMVAETPSLRAAWLDIQGRLVEIAMQELAAGAEIDPRDPEPMIAARALVGLVDVSLQARVRCTEEGLRGAQWRAAVLADVERAGRLLETGLWSFHLLTQGSRTRQQLKEATATAEQARTQVLDALRQARSAWRELGKREQADVKQSAKDVSTDAKQSAKDASTDVKRAARDVSADVKRAANDMSAEVKRAAKDMSAEVRRAARDMSMAERRGAKRTATRASRAAWGAAREDGQSLRDAQAAAQRAAYEAFRATLRERQQAIREQQAATREADRTARRG